MVLTKQKSDEATETRKNGGDPLLSREERAQLRILIVDSDRGLLENSRSLLESEGYDCHAERDAQTARNRLSRQRFDVVLVDEKMPGLDALDLLSELRKEQPECLGVLMTDNASTDGSIASMKAGAWDYFPKPFDAAQLLGLIGRAAYTLRWPRSVQSGDSSDGVLLENGLTVLGVSSALRNAVERALRVAGTDASVLITGESGTGKELFARLIHEKSKRSRRSFVPLNCAALPSELLESEMFGHRKGAFTGAVRDKPGLLETADGGTLFLDELADMPQPLQAKLLRVVQDGAVRRVGSEEEVDKVVDVRFISATNHDPEEALEEGTLREDLYYRLRVVPIRLPPLRERPEDIPVLIRHFMSYWWSRYRGSEGPAPGLSPEALEELVRHPWPGNVREVENVVEQLVIFSDPDRRIQPEELPINDREPASGDSETSEALSNGELEDGWKGGFNFKRSYHEAKKDMVDRFEREYLTRTVVRADGNLSEAARQSDVDRTTLYRLMDKHGLSRDAFTM